MMLTKRYRSLLTCALFSGQLLAKQQDHTFVWFATGGSLDTKPTVMMNWAAEKSAEACAASTTGEIAQTKKAIFVN